MNVVIDRLFENDLGGTLGSIQTGLMVLLMSFCIGHVIAAIYVWTHTGLSYSQMFTASLLTLPVIISLVMMLMAGNIIMAIGLLAVFAIVRFRNVLKDTRDTTFILWAIVEGIACGTMRFGIALLGCAFIGALFVYQWLTGFGCRQRYDAVLTVQSSNGTDSALEALRPVLRRHALQAYLANQRELPQERTDFSYRLLLRDPARSKELVSELQSTHGISFVSLHNRQDESEV